MKRFLIILLLFIAGCGSAEVQEMGHKNVEITTEDGIKIAGDLYEGGEKGIILLHIYTATKRTWEDFARELQKKGYSVLAIDFRGHGMSELTYKDFTEKDFNNMIYDVRAAKEFLGKGKNLVMGASIGANIALKFANEVDGAVLLSPSFNYKGIKTEDDATGITKPVLIIVSEEDRQSVGDSKSLSEFIRKSKLEVYSGKGHGTNMLDAETKKLILEWLQENF